MTTSSCRCPSPFAVTPVHVFTSTCIVGFLDEIVFCWCDRVRGRHARASQCDPDGAEQ